MYLGQLKTLFARCESCRQMPIWRPGRENQGLPMGLKLDLMRIFVSSTAKDLSEHRAAVLSVLHRMQTQAVAMEYFGSLGDEPGPVCRGEIDGCDILVGIYAWRYGWQPPGEDSSITEQEFDFARAQGKNCLCYVIDEEHPWPPSLMDRGEVAKKLERFKEKVSRLVRSRFTTAENLAAQVAADLARELAPSVPSDSFGMLMRQNWDKLDDELKAVWMIAYGQATLDQKNPEQKIGTRHVISALATIPNSAIAVLKALKNAPIDVFPHPNDTPTPFELFSHSAPVSACVLGSMKALLPHHSTGDRLLAIELAVDLLKNGRGSSVAKFRQAGIDAAAVETTYRHIVDTASNRSAINEALKTLNDAELLQLAYAAGLAPERSLSGEALRSHVISRSSDERRSYVLVGELIRRRPGLVSV
jgi:hypothetical protein